MAIEKAKELLEAIKTDLKAKELLKGVSEPRSEEEMIRLCAEIAPKLGFDITEAELREAGAALAKERQDKTAADVQKLSDEEVAQASGGELWINEDAPDGHEYDCLITYHSHKWQIQHGYSCEVVYLCSGQFRAPDELKKEWPKCADQYFTTNCYVEYY